MITWTSCAQGLPADQQECILYSDKADKVVGPIVFHAQMGGWLDLFATPEAGEMFMPGVVTHWAPWDAPGEAAEPAGELASGAA